MLSGEKNGTFCSLGVSPLQHSKLLALSQSSVDLGPFLHEGGGPQLGEVTCGGLPHLTCKREHIKMRDYMDRRVTLPKRVTSPTWGSPPSCKQALNDVSNNRFKRVHVPTFALALSSTCNMEI